jgi:membrane-associated HD superfamily phosphohydrolase
MVIRAKYFLSVCLGATFFISAVHGKDLATYRTGDTAEENISTPVALDVIDADATTARRTAEALKTPAIFRNYPDTTNTVVREFLTAFETVRASFNADLRAAFGQITNADETIASSDFTNLVTAFNRKKNFFPVTASLARLWAGGDSGLAIQNTFVDRLNLAMRRPIRADELPAGFVIGDTLRLVNVDSPQETLTLDAAERRGKIATETSVATLTRARSLLRKEFPDDEQNLARAVAGFLKSDCALDENLTQQSRARDVRQLVVVDHYDAGQIIVQRGEIIDAKTLAALAQLSEKLMPGQLASQIAAQRELIQQEQNQAQIAHAAALKSHDLELNLHSQALAARARNEWLLVALAGISIVALTAFWILARNRGRGTSLLPARVEKFPPQNQAALASGLAPQLAQILKEAVVQGLATQRSELLQAQRAAATEISELVQRLDELKAPMQERLRSYEERIVELEKDLAERNEENRELLKMKIEMIRNQLETERARNRADFN